ncbi:MAG: endonuclease/exonuclease/phosphatase family protein [Candidatus Woesearchaeota archaeon]|jgi:endonuclease/exonuclease/phosphatase family metal-dependent hydrolase
MKLINFNICIKIDNSYKVGEFIKSKNPDIVTFQEVTRHLDESVLNMYKSQKIIDDILKNDLPYSFFGPLFKADKFTKNGQISRNINGFIEQGNEIKSKFPIITAKNEFYYRQYELSIDRTNFELEDHPRAIQIVEINVNNNKLHIINVHGTYTKNKKDTERTLIQTQYIISVAKKIDAPLIIVGDFNLSPETKSIKLLTKEFRNLIDEYNINSTRPEFDDGLYKDNVVVDYIFVNDKIKINNFEVCNTQISDHLPLILDFDIIN